MSWEEEFGEAYYRALGGYVPQPEEPWASLLNEAFDFGEEGFEEASMEQEFAAEQLYRYHTALDERVCGRCAPLEGVLFSLEEIVEQFPSNENYEDIIFANVHDRCRCQLTKEPTPEGIPSEEEESMVEGRGAPLTRGMIGRSTSAPSLVGLLLHPSPRGFARFGIRQLLGTAALSFLISPILAIAMPLITQMINQVVQWQVRTQVENEVKRSMAEEERYREERVREIYKGIAPE